MTFDEYCNNYCPYRHNENKRHMEPCINCPLMTWLDMLHDNNYGG